MSAPFQEITVDPEMLAAAIARLTELDIPAGTDSAAARESVARQLLNRGVPPERFAEWLAPGEDSLPAPFMVMQSNDGRAAYRRGIEHFATAVRRATPDHKMAIWGDYDADGNTGVALLKDAADQLSGEPGAVLTYIPNRAREGYGLNRPGIKRLFDSGVRDLFTVDVGTEDDGPLAYAKTLGMTVTVIDHHTHDSAAIPLSTDATIINPNAESPRGPGSVFSGVGLARLFVRDACLRLNELGESDRAARVDTDFMDMCAAIGQLADVMPQQHPANRFITTQGLDVINSGDYLGLTYLMRQAGITRCTVEDILMAIGPVINAAGRLDDPTVGMRLLLASARHRRAVLASDHDRERMLEREIDILSKELPALNEERKLYSNHLYLLDAEKQAEAQIAEFRRRYDTTAMPPFLLVDSPNWSKGVVGIVASRLMERYHVPVGVGFTRTRDDGRQVTSASFRSIKDADGNWFDLAEHLIDPVRRIKRDPATATAAECAFADAFLGLGGHKPAAGGTYLTSERDGILSYAWEHYREPTRAIRDNQPVRYVQEIALADLTPDLVERTASLGPFGPGNEPPRYLLKNVQVKLQRGMGERQEHRRVVLGAPGRQTPDTLADNGIAWRAMDGPIGTVLTDPNRHNQSIDAVIEPYLFDDRGERKLGYQILDVSAPRIVSRDPAPAEQLREFQDVRVRQREKDDAQMREAMKQPRKLHHLNDPGNADGQQALARLYRSRSSVVDFETTGLKASHPDIAERNAITQVAAAKVREVQTNGKTVYHLERLTGYISPETPAHSAYAQQVTAWEKDKRRAERDRAPVSPPPVYDIDRYEYETNQDALGVTGTQLLRDHPQGPITGMMIGDTRVDAKPFYAFAPELAAFLKDTIPHAFNMPFDSPVMYHQFRDVLLASVDPADPLPSLQLDADGEPKSWLVSSQLPRHFIDDDKQRDRYRKTVASLLDHHAAQPDWFENLKSPALYHCALYSALAHKGEGPENRLEHMAPRYGIDFTRDEMSHDAIEDIAPLAYMLSDQMEAFLVERLLLDSLFDDDRFLTEWQSIQRKLEEDKGAPLSRRELHYIDIAALFGQPRFAEERRAVEEALLAQPISMADNWSLLIHRFDPDAEIWVHDEKTGKGIIPGEIGVRWSNRMQTDPLAKLGQQFLWSLVESKDRNKYLRDSIRRQPAQEVPATPREFILQSMSEPGGTQVQHLTIFKKLLAVAELAKDGMITDARLFDSTSAVDLTLADGTRRDAVPFSGLRKSLDYLLDESQRNRFSDNLALLQQFQAMTSGGLVYFDADGTVVAKGRQRSFGQVRFTMPEGYSPSQFSDEFCRHAELLIKIGGIPGVEQTEQELEENEANPLPGEAVVTYLTPRENRQVTMEISARLFEIVATSHHWPVREDAFILPGGLQGHFDRATNRYLLLGDLKPFEELAPHIRNAGWLLHRFNTLPGVRPQESEIVGDTLILRCQPAVKPETLWTLHRAHVPFTAGQRDVTIPIGELLHDAYHYFYELRKEQKAVGDILKRKESANASNRPPGTFEASGQLLIDQAIETVTFDRVGQGWAKIGQYEALPINPELARAGSPRDYVLTRQSDGQLAPSLTPFVNWHAPEAVAHDALSHQLETLHDIGTAPMTIGNGDDTIRLTAPEREMLSDATVREYQSTFHQHARLAKSNHIEPLLNALRPIATGDAMQPSHQEPNHEGASPHTLSHATRLADSLTGMEKMFSASAREVDTIISRFNQEKLTDLIFRDVAQLAETRELLLEARDRGEMPDVPDDRFAIVTDALQHYYESLKLADFKRYRLIQDARDFEKSLAAIQALPATLDPAKLSSIALDQSARLLDQWEELKSTGYIVDIGGVFFGGKKKTPLDIPFYELESAVALQQRYPGEIIVPLQDALDRCRTAMNALAKKDADAAPESPLPPMPPCIDAMERALGASRAAIDVYSQVNDRRDPYMPYKLHAGYQRAIEKVWDDARKFKRTLQYSHEIIASSVDLSDWNRRDAVRQAADWASDIRQGRLRTVLEKVRQEGGIRDYVVDGPVTKITDAALRAEPDYWADRLYELKKGKSVMPDKPIMLIDTSSPLELLTGLEHFPGDRSAAYFNLIESAVANGLFRAAVTQEMVAEFLNSPVPLSAEDLFVTDASGRVRFDTDGNAETRYGREHMRHTRYRNQQEEKSYYPKFHERLNSLARMLNAGGLEIIETATGTAYLQEMRRSVKLAKQYVKLYGAEAKAWRDLTDQELKTFWLDISESNIPNRRTMLQSLKSTSLRQHIGEVSMADAIDTLESRHGRQVPTIMLYHGSDVRSRVVKRKNSADKRRYQGGPDHDETGQVRDWAKVHRTENPRHKSFDLDNRLAFGPRSSFLSTQTLLERLMHGFGDSGHYVINSEELRGVDPLQTAMNSYRDGPQQESAKTLSSTHNRPYDRFKDHLARDMLPAADHEIAEETGLRSPFKELVESQPDIIRRMAIEHSHMLLAYLYDRMAHRHYLNLDDIRRARDLEQRLGGRTVDPATRQKAGELLTALLYAPVSLHQRFETAAKTLDRQVLLTELRSQFGEKLITLDPEHLQRVKQQGYERLYELSLINKQVKPLAVREHQSRFR